MKPIVIAGIGTGVGKTIVSAILLESLGAAYWKPIQTGDDNDTETLRSLVSNHDAQFLPERYCLKMPASPHIAAQKEGVRIEKADLQLPKVSKQLLIETAGGIMVPLNFNGLLNLDLIQYWNAEVVLVSRAYLGSINHTLMSIDCLQKRNISIKGLIFNELPIEGTIEIIEKLTHIPVLLRIEKEPVFTKATVSRYANMLIIP